MLHDITTNLKENKLVIVLRFEFFYLYVVDERKRMMKNVINDNFVHDTNKLSHCIDRSHKNDCHSHQVKRRHKSDHISALFDQRQLIVFEE